MGSSVQPREGISPPAREYLWQVLLWFFKQAGFLVFLNILAGERLIIELSEKKLKETNAVQSPSGTCPAVQKLRVKEEQRHSGRVQEAGMDSGMLKPC